MSGRDSFVGPTRPSHQRNGVDRSILRGKEILGTSTSGVVNPPRTRVST